MPEDEKLNYHNTKGSTARQSSLTVDAAVDRAFSAYGLGDFSNAEKLCRQILDIVPEHPDALQLLAGMLSKKGQYDRAAELLEKAIKHTPGHGQLHNNFGVALKQFGKVERSIEQFQKAIELRPDFAKAHNNLAAALLELGLSDKAVGACRQAISLRPNYKEACNNLGMAHRQRGDLVSAVNAYQQALEIDGNYANALSNLAMTLIAQGKLDTAENYLQKAVCQKPDSAEFINNLGVLFNRQGLFENAARQSQKAIDINPEYMEARNNLGTALMELARFDQAQAAFEKAIELDPECAPAHHNLGLILLLKGHYEQGWSQYEWRWQNRGDLGSTPKRPFKQKRWDGVTQGMGKLLIWTEQGVGDEAQFSGLVPYILSLGIDIILECDRRLIGLFKRSFPEITVVARTDKPAEILSDNSITHQIPIASIPNVLKVPLEEMVSGNAYLVADRQKRDRLRADYKKNGDELLIGISYTSSNRQQGPQRSVGLQQWGEILRTPNTRFINLQYGDCASRLKQARDMFGIEIIDDKNVDPIADLDLFSAQTAAMDLVISADNSTVHFAGALGVKTCTMLPVVPDWRWGLAGETTPWYRQMQLFRQEKAGRWETVISNIAEQLNKLANS